MEMQFLDAGDWGAIFGRGAKHPGLQGADHAGFDAIAERMQNGQVGYFASWIDGDVHYDISLHPVGQRAEVWLWTGREGGERNLDVSGSGRVCTAGGVRIGGCGPGGRWRSFGHGEVWDRGRLQDGRRWCGSGRGWSGGYLAGRCRAGLRLLGVHRRRWSASWQIGQLYAGAVFCARQGVDVYWMYLQGEQTQGRNQGMHTNREGAGAQEAVPVWRRVEHRFILLAKVIAGRGKSGGEVPNFAPLRSG